MKPLPRLVQEQTSKAYKDARILRTFKSGDAASRRAESQPTRQAIEVDFKKPRLF
jgi:hypothetical protein